MGYGSRASGDFRDWPQPRVLGVGSGSPTRREEPGLEAAEGAGSGVRDSVSGAERVLDQRWSRAPGLRACPLLGVPQSKARAAAGTGRVGGRRPGGTGALCAVEVEAAGAGRHVHGGPLLCGERVSVGRGLHWRKRWRCCLPAPPRSSRSRGRGGKLELGRGHSGDGLVLRAMTKRPETSPASLPGR